MSSFENKCPCSEENHFNKLTVMTARPQIVIGDKLSLIEKVRARLGFYKRFGFLYLGYCSKHLTYFLDLEHTRGGIRCPICDKQWMTAYIRARERARTRDVSLCSAH